MLNKNLTLINRARTELYAVIFREFIITYSVNLMMSSVHVMLHVDIFRCVHNILQCHYNGPNGVSNHQHHDCLLNRLFRCRSKKTSKLRVTGLCVGNSPVNGEFPAKIASNAESVSIWWRHHGLQFMSATTHSNIPRHTWWYSNVPMMLCGENDVWIVWGDIWVLYICNKT